ncbi:0b3bceac-78ae-4aeb-bba5-6fbaddbcd461 [Sclerotinia trifoliorum]|uniref:0b3bceac-78ae-4aeb-bba5-6fbaddbcd461 n=1 Tax=Sclerotinia trifoliorum TaxID=28548 RepID=A0A8H2VXF3_9HELO|nr:0b3bceac-78ae-4aeb-bba5-6fbaddbcd461 [Sclerotinia trifoliorum]
MHRTRQLPADTPLLRVSRPVSACSRCRAAKVKCDGKLPACSACEKSGRASECSSANDQFAKGKERSYVASLESRVEKLEKRLAYARLRKASVAMHDLDTPTELPDRKDSLATIRAVIHGKAARKREAADVNELVSDFGFLSVHATTRDFESSTTNMTFARLILSAANHDELPEPWSLQLPPRPAATKLIQYYLDNIFALYPIVSETALFNALDKIYPGNSQRVTDFEHWLFYMVLAISSTAQSRSHLDSKYEEGVCWAGRALAYADHVLMPGHVSQIQALVLFVQYAMLDPAHFDSWQLMGFTCRAIVDLGFHQDPPGEQQPDRKALDMRRRIFYCVYSLDRSISMVHARAFSFTDDSSNVEYPSASPTLPSMDHRDSVSGPHSMESAHLLWQLRRAQSSWYQELFQSSREPLPQGSTYLWKMCREMREWSESFPDSLPLVFKDFFDLELLYSYVYCLAPSCRVHVVSDYAKNLIFEYAITYMQRIFPISQDPINKAFYTYHDALRVYFIGSQLMAVLSGSQDQIFNGSRNTSGTSSSSPPPLPSVTGLGQIDRSINCINHIKETLRTFGQRWEDSKALLSSFDAQAEPIIISLHMRKQQHQQYVKEEPSIGHSPNYMSPTGYDHTVYQMEHEWPGMNLMFSNSDVSGFSGAGHGARPPGL